MTDDESADAIKYLAERVRVPNSPHIVSWQTVGGLSGRITHYCKHTTKHEGTCECNCGVWLGNE